MRFTQRLVFLCSLIVLCLAWMPAAKAQDASSVPVTISSQTQVINGKNYYVHIVQRGQTVFSIARAYGLKYYDAVIKTDIHLVSVGDTVWLPCSQPIAVAESRTVKVEAGQTLYGLSKAYGVTVEQILEANPEVKANGLKAGQTVTIPAAGSAPAAPKREEQQPPKKEYTANIPQNGQFHYQEVETAAVKESAPEKPATATPTPAGFALRNRISPDKVYITLMMPLYLDRIDEISTTKFDVDQRGRKDYKSFEFIQFYEGIMMGLEELKKQGTNVVLNVVDVSSEKEADITAAFNSHHAENSDLIIALLLRNSFETVAKLAQQHQVFVVCPLSQRSEVLNNNPYVVKYMPSTEGEVASIIRTAAKNTNPQLFVVHSNSKVEAPVMTAFQEQLKAQNTVKYTFFDWSANAKLVNALKAQPNCMVVNIYDQGNKDRNRIQTNLLMNRMNSIKSNTPVLITRNNYLKDYSDIDFNQLQNLSYHMVNTAYLDYDNPVHKRFIDTFKDTYLTEPSGQFAGIGNDIIIYFASGLSQKGSDFWKDPSITPPHGMLFPFHLKQVGTGNGFENQAAVIYKMDNFKLIPVNGRK